MKKFLTFICFISFFIVVNCQFGLDTASGLCKIATPHQINWDEELMCTYQHKQYKNSIGDNMITFAQCVTLINTQPKYENLTNNFVIKHAGSCSCPLNCSSNPQRGLCNQDLGSCECKEGYRGQDCMLVDCDINQCSSRGTCKKFTPNLNNPSYTIETCQCKDGWAGDDCSILFPSLPEPKSVLDIAQYSEKDKYKESNPMFDNSTIASYYIEMSESDLEFFMKPENFDTDKYVHSNITMFNNKFDDGYIFVEDAGIRIKGGASRHFLKKSWKISFSKFSKGRKFFQQKKISLKSAAMDPSYTREILSRDMYWSMGSATERMSYSNVWINKRFMGLFVIQEVVDDQFYKSRFGTDDVYAWKQSGGAVFYFNGTSCANYSSEVYKPASDLSELDCAPLIKLIDLIWNSDQIQFNQKISDILDIEYFARTLVVDVATGNWDGILDGNNFYLVMDPNAGGKFKYFRIDLDMSIGSVGAFGLFPSFNTSLLDGNIYKYGTNGIQQTFLKKLFSFKSFTDIYTKYFNQLIELWYNFEDPTFRARYSMMHESILPAALNDYWHKLDLSWSYQETVDNFDTSGIVRPIYRKGKETTTLDITTGDMINWMKTRISSAQKNIQDYYNN